MLHTKFVVGSDDYIEEMINVELEEIQKDGGELVDIRFTSLPNPRDGGDSWHHALIVYGNDEDIEEMVNDEEDDDTCTCGVAVTLKA